MAKELLENARFVSGHRFSDAVTAAKIGGAFRRWGWNITFSAACKTAFKKVSYRAVDPSRSAGL
jgi:hypothetical protein